MLIKKNSFRGVAALITVVSLGSLIFIISLSTTILAFWGIKNIDSNQKSTTAYYAAYSGIQDALVKLERNKDFSGEYSLSINDTNDVTIIVSNTGSSATITSSAVVGQIQKTIQTTANIDSTTGLITPVQTEEMIISAISTTTTTTLPEFVCGDDVSFTYKGSLVTDGTVESEDGCWLDRNLDASRVATAYNDSDAYGDLFQWGRLDDGHQNRNSGTTDILSSTDDPGHSNFIKSCSSPYDWRSPQNNNLWQGEGGINNPCPPGWRLPTESEWTTEMNSWGSSDYNGAYASPLKLTAGGYRSFSSASLGSVGSSGCYGSSTVVEPNARTLYFDSSFAGISSFKRAGGPSVRCVKD